jgi:hypothetical protein
VVAIVLWDHVVIGISLAPADDGIDRTFRNGKVAQEGPVVVVDASLCDVQSGARHNDAMRIESTSECATAQCSGAGAKSSMVVDTVETFGRSGTARCSDIGTKSSDPVEETVDADVRSGINAQDPGLPPGNVTLRPSNASVLLCVADAAAAEYLTGVQWTGAMCSDSALHCADAAKMLSCGAGGAGFGVGDDGARLTAKVRPAQCGIVLDPCCGTGTVCAVAATRAAAVRGQTTWFGLGGELEQTVATGFESPTSLEHSVSLMNVISESV